MSRLRKYPGDGEEPPDDPFVDKEGRNRFADRDESLMAVPAEAVGPYAGGAGGAPAYQAGGFHATMPHRGGKVFVLGLVGLVGAALFAFCWPMLILNLAVALPAWLMGQADLRAMQAGAMNSEGRGMTLAGYILGMIGTVGTIALFVGMAWMTFSKLRPW